MKKIMTVVLVMSSVYFLCSAKTLNLKTEKVVEVGKGTHMFRNITSVCEDHQMNFYVLDNKSFKIKKFSPSGEKLLSFGRKGKGPGEITRPHRVACAPNKQIVVSERIDIVSFFDKQGKFLDKINFSTTTGFVFYCNWAGNDLFYGEKRLDDGSFKQILFNKKGEIIQDDLFSIPPPGIPVNGRNYLLVNEAFSPTLFFCNSGKRSAVAVSDQYKIFIMDQMGNKIKTISRNVTRPEMTAAEKDSIALSIKDTPFPPGVGKELIRKIPNKKNYFRKISITEKYVFAFRINDDICSDTMPVNVDVFSISGKFMGTLKMKHIPIFISNRFIYTKIRAEKGNSLVLLKESYELSLQ